MKSIKIIYWITTAIVGLMMTYSAYAYLTQPMMTQAFHHLGYPDYLSLPSSAITGCTKLPDDQTVR